MSVIDAGWQVMLMGLGGVFITLIIFFYLMKFMVWAAKKSKKSE